MLTVSYPAGGEWGDDSLVRGRCPASLVDAITSPTYHRSSIPLHSHVG